MKKINTIALLILILFTNKINAQLDFTYTGNTGNEVTVKDLYQFFVLNNYSSTVSVGISFDLYSQNKVVYKSRVENVELGAGSNNLNFQSFSLTQEQFLESEILNFLSKNNVLPAGRFNWCLRIFDKVHKEELERVCFPLIVEPTTPPLLVYPPNNSILEEGQTTFTWIGPSPDANNFLYEITLAEIIGKQSPLDAVKRNFQLLKIGNLSEVTIQYPLSSPELEFGKNYAWQVKAYNKTGSVLYTEVWRFKLQRDTSFEKIVFYENFIIPRNFKDGSAINILNEIKVDMSSVSEISTISYQIIDMQDKVVIDNDLSLINSITGNRFILDLSKSTQLKNKNSYMLKIRSSKDFESYVLFKYHKNYAK